MTDFVVEPQAQAVVDATSQPPHLKDLGPEGARKVLADLQSAPTPAPTTTDEWVLVPAAVGDIRVRIVKPVDAPAVLPTVLYMHGGGWVLGDAQTHDRLVRDLAVGAGAAIVFVEYDRAPEARYPIALEQGYAAAQWVMQHGAHHGLDASRLAVAGDSVGGNLATALAILAKRRGDVRFLHQSLYYPVTDARQDTASYRDFAEGAYLRADAMAWFWDCYLPDATMRSEITASPLQATLEDLAGLPETFLVVDENDVLRDEGEAYGRRLIQAGVRATVVRYDATVHDFMMLNPLRPTAATTAAVEQAAHVLRSALDARKSA